MDTGKIHSATEQVVEYGKLWKHIAELAKWQHKAATEWQGMFGFSKLFPLASGFAPTNLSQNINPWNLGLIQVVGETRGDPKTEVEILTKVAGYGSQLGTIIDALEAILPNAEARKGLDEDTQLAILKLKRLARDIRRVKSDAEKSV